MKAIKILAFIVIACITATNVQAQEEYELTEEQKELFQNRVKQKVEEFQSSLSNIVNEKLDHSVRKEEVKNLLLLFMGGGEPYEYYDEELDRRITSSGVKMETSSTRTNRITTQKIKNYIYKLYDPETGTSKLSYSEIIIKSAAAVRVDNVERVGDHYECIAYFCQKFIGTRDGKIVYIDTTCKKIKCYITMTDLPTGKKIFEAKLGDIMVTSTE